MINQVITGIQQASKTGSTELPSVIYLLTNLLKEQVKLNFVPEPQTQQQADYIKKHETESQMENLRLNSERDNKLDNLYDEIQSPLLIGVLFFMFQLPFFKSLLKNFTSLYTNDGNINMYGYLKLFYFQEFITDYKKVCVK